MQRTRVVNIRLRPYDVLIDRSTKWGNPFTHRDGTRGVYRVGTRNFAVSNYLDWIKTQPELIAALPELRGKILGCHCKPLACHGDVLAALADGLIKL